MVPTAKYRPLLAIPFTVTETFPEEAPAGTTAVTEVEVQFVMLAVTPPKFTKLLP